MLSNIVLGQYFKTKSILHNLKATTKLIALFISLIGIMAANYYGVMIFLGLTICLIIISKIPTFIFIKQILTMKYLYIFLIVLYLINHTLLYDGLFMIIRIVLLIIGSSLLILTTKPEEITEGLKIILNPLNFLKIPVDKIALILSLAISFIPTIFLQIERILKALKSKGLDYSTSSFKEKIEIISTMLLPVFVLSMMRAETLAEAMEIRLYEDRTTNYLNESKTNYIDYGFLLIHAFLIVIIFR